MATQAQNELYPLASNDREAIPLEVIRPEALLRVAITDSASNPFTIPATWELCAITASKDCVIRFGTAATYPVPEETELTNALFCPAGVTLTSLVIPGNCWLVPAKAAETGYCFLQKITRWAGIGQAPNLTRR